MSERLLSLAQSDLNEILKYAAPSWDVLAGKRLFLTGATGFIGKWLVQGLLDANKRLGLGISMTVLSRNPSRSLELMPWLEASEVTFLQGDVRSFEIPESHFDFVFHGAVEASADINARNPWEMLSTNIDGMRRVTELARRCGVQRLLLTSSGAVYGRQPLEVLRLEEEDRGGPDPLGAHSAYSEGKRVAELLGAIWSRETGGAFLTARCFAFLGPYLPLDSHFAAGNFIRDCLEGSPVVIKGDGSPIRSLMYGTDMVVWLLRVLTHGRSLRPYNVGADHAITIREMAEEICAAAARSSIGSSLPKNSVRVLGQIVPGRPSERYLPSVDRAKSELDLAINVPLAEAIDRTLRYFIGERKGEAFDE